MKWAKWAAIIAVISGAILLAERTGFVFVTQNQFIQAQAQQDNRITANEEYRYLERFRYLEAKRARGGLTLEEQKELCLLAKILNFRAEGCG